MATDGVVQVFPDGSGKKIDVSELTRADATIVERQRVVIGSPDDAQQELVSVRGESGKGYILLDERAHGLLQSIDQTQKEILELMKAILCS